MRWLWRGHAEPESTGGQEAAMEAARQLREVRRRWPEIHSTVRELRESIHSAADRDPFVEAVRREFGNGRHA